MFQPSDLSWIYERFITDSSEVTSAQKIDKEHLRLIYHRFMSDLNLNEKSMKKINVNDLTTIFYGSSLRDSNI